MGRGQNQKDIEELSMENKNRTLRRWRDNENMDLDDMYNKAAE